MRVRTCLDHTFATFYRLVSRDAANQSGCGRMVVWLSEFLGVFAVGHF